MFANVKFWFDIAVGVLIVGLVVFAGWAYDQAKLARKDTVAAQAAMTQLQQGLAQIQAGQQASDESIKQMADAMSRSTEHATTVARRVVTMGNNDATIQKWLDTPLPAGGCMLDDTCAGGSAASAAQRGPAAPLHAASAGALGH